MKNNIKREVYKKLRKVIDKLITKVSSQRLIFIEILSILLESQMALGAPEGRGIPRLQ